MRQDQTAALSLPAHATLALLTRTCCVRRELRTLDLAVHGDTTLAGIFSAGALLDHAALAGTSLAGTSLVGTSLNWRHTRCHGGGLLCALRSPAPNTRARCSAAPNNPTALRLDVCAVREDVCRCRVSNVPGTLAIAIRLDIMRSSRERTSRSRACDIMCSLLLREIRSYSRE